MTRRIIVLAVFLSAVLALGVGFARSSARRDPWLVAHGGLDYGLYEPRATLGLKLTRFAYPPCSHSRSTYSLYTDYGGRARGFELVEESPQICANAAPFIDIGTRMVGAVQAHLGVYCSPSASCSLAQGVENGYTLYWTQGRTRIQINSRHLTLAQLVRVAASLRLVR